MTTTQEPWLTLLEVFNIVGQWLYGSDWVGMQLQKVRQRVIASTEDMRKAIEPSQTAPDLPTEEVTLELHCEANAQELPSLDWATREIANGRDLSHYGAAATARRPNSGT